MTEDANEQYELRLEISLFRPARGEEIKEAVEDVWPFEGWDHNPDFVGDRPGWHSVKALKEDRQYPIDVPDTFMGAKVTGNADSALARLFVDRDNLRHDSILSNLFRRLQEVVWSANDDEFCFVDLWPAPSARWALTSLDMQYDALYGIERPWDADIDALGR